MKITMITEDGTETDITASVVSAEITHALPQSDEPYINPFADGEISVTATWHKPPVSRKEWREMKRMLLGRVLCRELDPMSGDNIRSALHRLPLSVAHRVYLSATRKGRTK